MARRREADEKGVLHTLVAARAGGHSVRVRRRGRSLGQEAGPTTTPHLEEKKNTSVKPCSSLTLVDSKSQTVIRGEITDLGAANMSVDALAGVALLLPAATVRKLQAGVTT